MISVKDNIREVLSFTDRLSSQYHFAVANALTDTARKAAQAMPAEAARDLDDPTPFTLKGFFSTGATKDKLTATVGVKDKQAEYLRYQIEGGTRPPKRKALRLPSDVKLNEYGNMPKGMVADLIARAKSGKRATKRQAAKFGVSRKVELFYGQPDVNGWPAGIYKRVPLPRDRDQLVPLVVFPKQAAKYRKRFDFYATAERIVRVEFPPALRRAWALAHQTAKR